MVTLGRNWPSTGIALHKGVPFIRTRLSKRYPLQEDILQKEIFQKKTPYKRTRFERAPFKGSPFKKGTTQKETPFNRNLKFSFKK